MGFTKNHVDLCGITWNHVEAHVITQKGFQILTVPAQIEKYGFAHFDIV